MARRPERQLPRQDQQQGRAGRSRLRAPDINGADYPSGCKIKSFTTADLSAAWKFGKNSEIFGSVQNVFDAKPPIDFLTYGAIGYNPLDYSGAIGRFFRVGVKHQF